ncbi:MAG: hypothetical protein EOO96_05905, partial [Pedobacter sp.]
MKNCIFVYTKYIPAYYSMYTAQRVFFCFVTCFVLSINLCLSQVPLSSVKYLGVENGLSNNVVNSLYLDHFGFMWLGTYDGLNRYDGYNFKVFRNNFGVDNSLINNHIAVLNGDNQNRIWIGTQKGVSYYSYADSKFHQLFYVENGKNTILTSSVTAIAMNRLSAVYIATDENGLFELKNGETFAKKILLKNVKNYTVKALCVSDEGVLWLFIKDFGLCNYDEKTGKINLVKPDIKNITSIINAENGALWLGTEQGLY